MRACASGMHYPFRNTFPIEVRDFFKKLIIFQRGRSAVTNRSEILIIGNRMALPCG